MFDVFPTCSFYAPLFVFIKWIFRFSVFYILPSAIIQQQFFTHSSTVSNKHIKLGKAWSFKPNKNNPMLSIRNARLRKLIKNILPQHRLWHHNRLSTGTARSLWFSKWNSRHTLQFRLGGEGGQSSEIRELRSMINGSVQQEMDTDSIIRSTLLDSALA